MSVSAQRERREDTRSPHTLIILSNTTQHSKQDIELEGRGARLELLLRMTLQFYLHPQHISSLEGSLVYTGPHLSTT